MDGPGRAFDGVRGPLSVSVLHFQRLVQGPTAEMVITRIPSVCSRTCFVESMHGIIVNRLRYATFIYRAPDAFYTYSRGLSKYHLKQVILPHESGNSFGWYFKSPHLSRVPRYKIHLGLEMKVCQSASTGYGFIHRFFEIHRRRETDQMLVKTISNRHPRI